MENQTVVYVIAGGGYCKVGISIDVERRLAEIQAHNPTR